MFPLLDFERWTCDKCRRLHRPGSLPREPDGLSPFAPKKGCLHPRCPGWALPGKARCQVHQLAYYRQDNAQRDPRITTFYNSTAWKKFRAAVRAARPWCETCEREGRQTPSEQVDHIVRLKEAPARALDETNVRALCMSCHSRRTMTDWRRAGGGTTWGREGR